MNLSSEQLAVVRKYTDISRIDQDKLMAYLQKHRTIKPEVFSYCSKVSKRSIGSRGYSVFLNKSTYSAIDRDTFIRRIPFYFFQVPFGDDTRTGLSKVFPTDRRGTMTAKDYESFYTDLECYDLAGIRPVTTEISFEALEKMPSPYDMEGPENLSLR